MTGRTKQDSTRFGLIAATVLLGSLACAKVAQCVVESRRIAQFAAYAAAQGDPDPNAAQPRLAGAKEVAQTLRAKNLFVKMRPKKHPVQQIDGILGCELLIGNKWYKAGDKIGDARVISVNSTHAVIEWDGKKKTFAPIAAVSAEAPPAAKPATAKSKEVKRKLSTAATGADVTTTAATETVVVEDPLGWLGIELPPQVRAMLLEKWNSASEEDKQKAKERWNSMSDEAKQNAVRQYEENM